MRDRRGTLGTTGGADTILVALAIRIKRRKYLAIILFDGAEVAIGHRNQAFALAALLRRHHFLKGRIVLQLGRITKRRRMNRRALHDGFHLGDLIVRDFQPQREEGTRTMFLDRAEPRGIAGGRVRHFKAGS